MMERRSLPARSNGIQQKYQLWHYPTPPSYTLQIFFSLFLKDFKGWNSTQITQMKAPLIHNATLREMLLLSRGHPEGRQAQMNPLRKEGGGGREGKR